MRWPCVALGGVRTAMPRRSWPIMRRTPGRMSLICAATSTTLALSGRSRAGGMIGLTATTVALGGIQPLTLRLMCRNLCIATVAEITQAEERQWTAPARSLRLFAVVFSYGTRQLHLVASFLANLLVAGESSTPHTEPAMDGRCLRATTAAVLLLLDQNENERALLCFTISSEHAP